MNLWNKYAANHSEDGWLQGKECQKRWSEELTIMRKCLNELGHRYQRTRNSEEIREQRRSQYLEGKAIKKDKIT